MPRPTTFQVAIACGAAGAYVDVSAYLESEDGFTYSWGRQSGFDDAAPAEFSFTLNNYDGRFTPENPSSPLALKLTEGMGVSWLFETRLVSGTIQAIEPEFPGGVAAWSRVVITCDDVLGDAARTGVDSAPFQLVKAVSPYLWWRFDELVGSPAALESSGNNGPALTADDLSKITFGEDGVPAVDAKQVRIAPPNVGTVLNPDGLLATAGFPTVTYPTNSGGSWGVWSTPSTDNQPAMLVNVSTAGGSATGFQVTTSGGYYGIGYVPGAVVSSVVPVRANMPVYLSVSTSGVLSGTWTVTSTLSVNGVAVASQSTGGLATYSNADRQITSVRLGYRSGMLNTESGTFSNLSHTPTAIDEYAFSASTEAQRLAALSGLVPVLTLDTLPTDLSLAPLGVAGGSGSVLDLFNDVIRGEQGHIYSTTTGTLLAPVQKVTVKSRTRPTTVTTSFAVETDTNDVPDVRRDATNLVSTVKVDGADDLTVTVTDTTLVARAKSSDTTETVDFSNYVDLLSFGQDRLLRGANTQLQVFKLTIDGRGSTTNRLPDLITMVPGNRYQITGLPSAQLGFSTWDGWFLGASEYHSTTEDTFELYFSPVLAATGIFDTDRFTAGGELTLTASINAAVTSMSLTTTGSRAETVDVPYNLLIDTEIVTVTACSGATPQIATIVRGVGGTTAATHAAGAAPELSPATTFAY